MTMFIVMLAGVALLPMVMLLRPLLNRGGRTNTERDRINIEIARDRLNAMELSGESDPSEMQSAQEIQAGLLDDLDTGAVPKRRYISSRWAVPVILLIPIVSYLLYSQLGSPDLAKPQPTHSGTDTDIDQLVALMEEKLARNPIDANGWALAGRTYMSLQDYDKARTAYQKLNKLAPGNPDYLAAQADATIMASDNRYTEEAEILVKNAIKIDPNNINALWLAGLGALSLGQYDTAITYLQRLKSQTMIDAATLEQVDMLIARAESLRGERSGVQPAPVAQRTLSVIVEVNESLLGEELPADGILYVFAKAQAGPPAPLAVMRRPLGRDSGRFPVEVVLDESMAVMPGMTISDFDQITVGARISASGNATPEPGDFKSEAVSVDLGADKGPVFLLIDSVID